MKAFLKNQFKGYSGKMEGCVAYYHPVREVFLVRSLPVFVPNARTQKMHDIMVNLKQLNPSAAYKRDFKDYLFQYNQLEENRSRRLVCWSNIYLKLLYAMQKAVPNVDLLTLSRAQIEKEDLPCRTLKAAIDAGLLPRVEGYARFTHII